MVTRRDRIWATTLDLIEYNRSITASDVLDAIDDPSPSKRTVRNTLDAMETMGYLGSKGGRGSAPREYFPPELGGDEDPGGYTPRKTTHSSSIPFPGSKGHISDWIISHMPKHDTYVEAFGGSAAILLNKSRSKYEIYNDIDDDLSQFFRVVRDHPDELASWLQTVPYSRSQYETWVSEFYDGVRPDDPIERAGRFCALRYMQYAGVAGTKNGFKTRARRSPARTFANARDRIQSLANRFEQVTIECQDWGTIIDTYDDTRVDVLFYFDPPYIGSKNHYTGEFDRQQFVESLPDIKSDWMLSCKEVPTELVGYPVQERESRHRMQRSSNTVTEKLVFNFDP